MTFTVTGANAQAGSAVANSSGEASFTYEGTNVGTDHIVASFERGGKTESSNEVTKIWTSGTGGPKPTTTTTSLSGEGHSGGSITVKEGAAVSDSATLSGANAASAGGSVTYSVYTNNKCEGSSMPAGTVTVSAGSVPSSEAKILTPAGTYYWQASYSGDSNNEPSKSACGSEVETVQEVAESPKPSTTTTSLSGEGHSGASITVQEGAAVTDKATISGANASSATGTVTYKVYADSHCSGALVASSPGSVSGETASASSPATLSAGTYYWVAEYSGDSKNEASASACGSEVETVQGAGEERKPTSLRTWLCEAAWYHGWWSEGWHGCGWGWWSWWGWWQGDPGEHHGSSIYVAEDRSALDHALLQADDAWRATGTVTYRVYSDASCTQLVASAGTVTLWHGWIAPSQPLRLASGTYYWQASYSGDASYAPSTSACGSEVEMVYVPHRQHDHGEQHSHGHWRWSRR